MKDKIFFTSDLHFSHANIIKYCDRPFRNVKEMDKTLIDNWNSTVPEDGEIYVLGDLGCWFSKEIINEVLDKFSLLNGIKHLVLGNHDNKFICKKLNEIFKTVSIRREEIFQIDNRDQCVVMDHYPMTVWNGSHKGSWQLFGHIHSGKSNKGSLLDKLSPTQYDVGVDNNDFKPVSLRQIDEIITKQILQNQ